jgi:hypothetical protein
MDKIDRAAMFVLESDLIAYRDGIKRGVWWFATWENGEQRVGIKKELLVNVYKEIDEGKYD